MRLPHFFIDRPIFAAVLSIIILIIGAIAQSTLPIAEYPEIAPPTVNIAATYPGASAQIISETVATPDRARGQRRRRYALHRLAVDRRRAAVDQRRVQARHQHRSGAGAGAEPRLGGRAAPARGRAPSRHRGAQGLARPDDGRAHDLAGRHAATSSTSPTTRRSTFAMCCCVSMAWATSTSSAPATTRCASGSTRPRLRTSASRRPRSLRLCGRPTCRLRPARSTSRRRPRPALSSCRCKRWAGSRRRTNSKTLW